MSLSLGLQRTSRALLQAHYAHDVLLAPTALIKAKGSAPAMITDDSRIRGLVLSLFASGLLFTCLHPKLGGQGSGRRASWVAGRGLGLAESHTLEESLVPGQSRRLAEAGASVEELTNQSTFGPRICTRVASGPDA